MVLEKPLAPITFFLVLEKKLYRTNYLLENQNCGVQLIFKLKIKMGFIKEVIYSVLG